MSMPIISIENLGKRYRLRHQSKEPYQTLRGTLANSVRRVWRAKSPAPTAATETDFWALQDVNLEIDRGDVVGVIGRNGAGKSTLLKILSRITEPTHGRIRLRGRIASLLEVGTGFHPELTGRENIFLNGAILGMTKADIRRRFNEIVAFAEVDRFLDTPVKHYSSGMYVRLAFAVAAHLEPEILIIDEVLAVGDAHFQRKCMGKIKDVASTSGRTILFVSHNMAAVASLCRSSILLQQGRLLLAGPTPDVIGRYANTLEQASQGLEWHRAHDQPRRDTAFESIRAEIDEAQPCTRITCRIAIHSSKPCPDVMLAVDIADSINGVVLMQALPHAEPFASVNLGLTELLLQIDLPPLIPGRYTLDFWIGTHFTSTVDFVRQALAFEVTTSPTAGRSYPHSREHGFVVPSSLCTPVR